MLNPVETYPCKRMECPIGLQGALAAAVRHVRQQDSRPLLFAGAAGVGKSACARALAEALGRPFVAFEVAIAGLQLGQGDGLRELPLVPRARSESVRPSSNAAPVILIHHAERLPGGLTGRCMYGLVQIAREREPSTLEHHFGVEACADETLFVFTTTAGFFAALEGSLFVLELHGYSGAEKVAIARRLLEAQGKHLPATLAHELAQRCSSGPGVHELVKLVHDALDLRYEECALERSAPIAGGSTPSVIGQYAAPLAGQAVAMAWTADGGRCLVIEAAFGNEGERNLTVLGIVGEVMLGAARVAHHVVNESLRGSSLLLGAAKRRPVLLNLPGSWAHKKDGSSVGLAMGLAMYGVATQRRPRAKLAATGELSLRGQVLPVGNCWEKMLAAEREGITDAVIPRESGGVLFGSSDASRAAVRVHLVDSFAEAVELCFE